MTLALLRVAKSRPKTGILHRDPRPTQESAAQGSQAALYFRLEAPGCCRREGRKRLLLLLLPAVAPAAAAEG